LGNVCVVAEIGVNHNGSASTAIDLVEKAAWAGADRVKFQLWHKDTFPHIQHLRLSDVQLSSVIEYCDAVDMPWFATAFDIWAVDVLSEMGQTWWKIPNNPAVKENDALLRHIGNQRRECVIMSVDMRSSFMSPPFPVDYLLHCVSKYPTQAVDLTLRHLRGNPVHVGLSSHCLSTIAPAVAVGAGAEMIEQHITMDRNQEGPDHCASLEPDEFEQMVGNVRQAEAAI